MTYKIKMKISTKLKRKREEWVRWLLQGDDVNGKIDSKFEGIILHALEEHSEETAKQIGILVEKFEFSDYEWQEFLKELRTIGGSQ